MSYETNSFVAVCEELRDWYSGIFKALLRKIDFGLRDIKIAHTRCMIHPHEPHVLVLGRTSSGSVCGANQQLGF